MADTAVESKVPAVFDEEDEFEEFEDPDWNIAKDEPDKKQWEDEWDDAGWDDEDIDDTFQKKLREELDKCAKK